MKLKFVGIVIGFCMFLMAGFTNAAGADISVERITVYGKKVGTCNLIKVNLKNVGDQTIRKPLDMIVYIYNYSNIIKHYRRTIRSKIRHNFGVTFFLRDVEFPYSSSGWKVKVIADVNHVLRPGDGNELNNSKEITFSINSADTCAGKPDLKMGKIYFPDGPCHSGVNKLRVYVTSLNRVRLSTGIINVRVVANGTVLNGILRPRTNGTKWAYFVDFNVTIPNGRSFTVNAEVDYDRRIPEENENNNTRTVTFNCN